MSVETFKCIYKPAGEYRSSDVLECKYTMETINSKCIIFNSALSNYHVFDNPTNMFAYIDSCASKPYHEVIFGFQAQKVKVDIDASGAALDAFFIPMEDLINECYRIDMSPDALRELKARYILKGIICALKDVFLVLYQINLHSDDIIICESRGEPMKKWSYHLICKYAVSSNKQAVVVTKKLLGFLPIAYAAFIDAGVNKSLQNFRMIGCDKGDGRVKTQCANTLASRYDTLITYIDGCTLLPDLDVGIARDNAPGSNPEDVQEVLAICEKAGLLVDHQFRAFKNGAFLFNRIKSSFCDICARVHTGDNTLLVKTVNEGGLCTVYRSCWRGGRRIPIGSFTSSQCGAVSGAPAGVNSSAEAYLLGRIKRAAADGPRVAAGLFDVVPGLVYSAPSIRPFELRPTLCVRAQMKMGKTKALTEYIGKYFPNGLRKPLIRFISFRQTFSANIKEKFPDFELYSDAKGALHAERLIVQVESLYRVQTGEHPDLLILDECESIFEQFDSGLLKNFNASFAVFKWLLKYSKHVICMDANLSDRTYNMLQIMRPGAISYHHNTYKNALDDNYHLTTDKTRWLGALYTALEVDERIAVPMSSLTEAKTLYENVRRRFPNKLVKLYSSETSFGERREHFADVNLHWAQYDVLIYTPTISAGVSFEQHHFEKIFGYFTDQSCPVETCLQMIGRIRDVGAKAFYICINAAGHSLPATRDEIKRNLYRQRENLFKDLGDNLLTFELGEHGEVVYHNSDYFALWVENTLCRNVSKNGFIRRFIECVAGTGAQVHHFDETALRDHCGIDTMIDGCLNLELRGIEEQHQSVRADIKADVAQKIAAAPEISDEEADKIIDAIAAQKDISEVERHSYEKYKLAAEYAYGHEITPAFVATYRDPKVRRIYKNIKRISACADIDESLRRIQAEERDNYLYMMSIDTTQNLDINRKYVFEQHRLALGCLRTCGWGRIVDPRYIHINQLMEALVANERILLDNITNFCNEFQMRRPALAALAMKDDKVRYVGFIVGFINKILFAMYGIKITCIRTDPDMWYIAQCKLFTMDPADPKRRPLIV